MLARPTWSTACPDWAERITAQPQRSLIPFDPLFPAEAAAALDIFRSLRIVDAAGQPTFGQAARPWVLDLVGALFGAYDHDGVCGEAGRRLIQYYMLLVSKKNGKSTLSPGMMLTALIRNWRQEGEFYIIAPTKELADNSYAPAVAMTRADPVLQTILKPAAGRTIEHRNTGAFLRVIAADSEVVGGKKTIGLLVEELWLFGKRAGAEAMLQEAEGGLASRPEGFVIYITTHSDAKPEGVFDTKLKEFRAIRDGKVLAPNKLPVLYEWPQAYLDQDKHLDPANWGITNPNLDVSVSRQYLIDTFAEKTRAGRAALNVFLAKHLNVQISQAQGVDSWAGVTVWSRGIETDLQLGGGALDQILSRCDVVTLGLDGGGLDDLLGGGVIGRERDTNRWLAWGFGLVSTIGVVRRKGNAARYLEFVRAGDLFVYRFDLEETEEERQARLDPDFGPIFAELCADALPPAAGPSELPPDIRFIVNLVTRVRDAGLLAQVGVDAAGIGAIVDALAGIGITQDAETLDAVRQGIALMGAIKTVERKLADRSFRHADQPLLGWCAGNLRIVPTPTAMRVARDETGFGKIDPIMAVFNAAHLMSLNPAPVTRSVFETMGDEPLQSAAAAPLNDDEEAAILRDPAHPRWQEMRERVEARFASADDEEYL